MVLNSSDVPPSYTYQTVPKITTVRHSATVVFAHGLGDSSNGMLAYAQQMSSMPGFKHVKFLLPNAPQMAVTGSGGMVVPSWFDVYSFDIFNRAEDENSLLSAASRLDALITAEIEDHGIPPERIVVGGISQGGALACLTALTTRRNLAGLFMLSTYVPLCRKTKEIAYPTAPSIPIFWGHGVVDSQVNHDKAYEMASKLAQDLGVPIRFSSDGLASEDQVPLKLKDPGIRFNSYRHLPHWIDPENEIPDLAAWILGVLPSEITEASSCTIF